VPAGRPSSGSCGTGPRSSSRPCPTSTRSSTASSACGTASPSSPTASSSSPPSTPSEPPSSSPTPPSSSPSPLTPSRGYLHLPYLCSVCHVLIEWGLGFVVAPVEGLRSPGSHLCGVRPHRVCQFGVVRSPDAANVRRVPQRRVPDTHVRVTLVHHREFCFNSTLI
jgi:hypothetical protein